MKLKNTLLVILAVALGALAHGQGVDEIPVRCNAGHDNCRVVHGDEPQGAPPVDPGQEQGNGGGANGIDELGGGGGSTGGDGGHPVLTPPDNDPPSNGGSGKPEDELERQRQEAARQQRRLEEARQQAENARLSEAERRQWRQEQLAAEQRLRYEMNRGFTRVRQASAGSSRKLQEELKKFRVWQDAMVKAGLTVEVAEWYVTNKGTIEELVAAYGPDEDGDPGPLKWLADNQASIRELVEAKGDLIDMRDDHKALAQFYKDWKAEDGKTYEPLMKMAKNVEELDQSVASLWQSLGAETWVKVLAILGPVLAILAFLLRKK